MMNFEKMFAMMEKMEQMMEVMEKFETMMGGSSEPKVQVAHAEAVKPAVKRVTLEDLEEEELGIDDSELGSAPELGLWDAVSKNGKPYRFYGWADPVTGQSKFPGKQLYYVNDFYLKRDYGAYHPGKTTNYKFKDGGLRAALSSYKVRSQVDPKDADAFRAYIREKDEKKAQRNSVTGNDMVTSWIDCTKQ